MMSTGTKRGVSRPSSGDGVDYGVEQDDDNGEWEVEEVVLDNGLFDKKNALGDTATGKVSVATSTILLSDGKRSSSSSIASSGESHAPLGSCTRVGCSPVVGTASIFDRAPPYSALFRLDMIIGSAEISSSSFIDLAASKSSPKRASAPLFKIPRRNTTLKSNPCRRRRYPASLPSTFLIPRSNLRDW